MRLLPSLTTIALLAGVPLTDAHAAPLPTPKLPTNPTPTPVMPGGAPQPKLLPPAPAFANASVEQDAAPGWGIAAKLDLGKSARQCSKQEVASHRLRIAGKPVVDAVLGGDYWDVPFPAIVQIGQDGDCWVAATKNSIRAGLTSPTFDGSGSTAVSYLVRTEPVGAPVRVELRNGTTVLQTHRPTTAAGLVQDSFDLAAVPAGSRASLRLWFFAEGKTKEVDVDNVRLWSGPVTAWHGGTPSVTPDGVWGFADLHTHPAAHLGHGGLIFGAPDASWSDWKSCKHGGAHVNTSMLTEKIEPAGHAGTGATAFQYWPRFNSVTHQQIHEKWLKRAWQGGLRVVVFHAVNNALLARYFADERSWANDMVAAKRQLKMLRAWIAKTDFMEIAKSPQDARRIAGAGKLAVVLGVEIDSIGSCHEHAGLLSEQEVAATSGCNFAKVKAAIDDLYDNYDVRHIFPVHIADNDFGGAALYRREFAKFNAWFRGVDFQPTDAARPAPTPNSPVPHIGVRLTAGHDMLDDWIAGSFGNIGMDNKSWPGGPHVNSRALTPLGIKTIQYMWQRGMMVELDHMSELASRKAVSEAKRRGVAMVAGHTAPRELMFLDEAKAAPDKLAAENNKSDEQIRQLHAMGGVMGIGTGPADVEKGPFGANDCSGSSQSWLQFYTHTVALKSTAPTSARKGFVGVALGTDMHLQSQLYPRFGVWACMGRDLGVLATAMDAKRKVDAAAVDRQREAVSYKSPPWTYYSSRFQRPIGDGNQSDTGGGTKYLENYYRYPTEAYGGRERAVWHGLLLADAYRVKGIDPWTVDLSSAWNWWHWVDGARHFSMGFLQSAAQTSRDCHDVHPKTGKQLGGDGCGLRRAAYLVKAGRTSADPDDHPSVQAQVKVYMPMMLRVYKQYLAMTKDGGNKSAPLSRCEGAACGGDREFDYNLDGLAHYGLVPDFLQDAANQLRRRPTTHARDLRALFRGAEDYIESWETTWAKKK